MRISSLGAAFLALVLVSGATARAADQATVHQRIQQAGNWLVANSPTWNTDTADQGIRSLVALSLVKAHFDPNIPAISGPVQAALARCTADGYKPQAHHYYAAGVDASLLVEVGAAQDPPRPELYQAQLQIIADYIMAGQLANGGWDYPEGHGFESQTYYNGDTSVIQYCMLGLWAATRAGVQVPRGVWENCVNWHINNQAADGGYNYVPGLAIGPFQGATSLNMTAAAIGSTMIATMHLYPEQYDKIFAGTVSDPETQTEAETVDENGILEEVDLDAPPPPAEGSGDPLTAPEGLSSIPITTIQATMQRAMGFLGARFLAYNAESYPGYYYYTVERAASLSNVKQIGQYDWYNYCGDHLLSIQKTDGSWEMTGNSVPMDTAFGILFLSLSTGQIVRPSEPPPGAPDLAGVGQQDGGRGLPDDLNTFSEDAETAVAENLTGTNDLLSALANIEAGDVNIAQVQEALVRDIQLNEETREEWIEKKDELAELAAHPNPQVRRTAIWALGRTGDMSLAKLLITALKDPDVSVNIEANNALCWISRRPNGFNLLVDPLGGLPMGASPDQIEAVLAAWRRDAVEQWGTWYLRHRPFADRGDEFEAELRQELGR